MARAAQNLPVTLSTREKARDLRLPSHLGPRDEMNGGNNFVLLPRYLSRNEKSSAPFEFAAWSASLRVTIVKGV